jgi:hypothetical protein
MRLWAKTLLDDKPPRPITRKDKALVLFSVIVDATIIGLLVYVLLVNSCQICYGTGVGASTFTKCKSMPDIMETGLPTEIINVYEGNAITKNNLTTIAINGT